MGNPVVHFEIMGKDADTLRSYYHELFGWDFNADNPQNYGLVRREENLMPDGVGIGGGIGSAPNYDGHVTFYVGVKDVEEALAKAESLGGSRIMGPERVTGADGEVMIGLMRDPEGHIVGVATS
jgi:predicted enzyme related to lactoylglutathione lyase